MFSNKSGLGLSLIGGAPDDAPTRADAVEHYLAQARQEVEEWIQEGYVCDLEALYRRMDGDDSQTFWRAIWTRSSNLEAASLLIYARAQELADEEPSY